MELLIARSLTLLRGAEPLLRGASLTVRAGDRIGLVGANGSGKSTLLRVLAGERAPDDGSVRRAPGARVVLLRQDDALDDAATVREAALAALAWTRELEGRLREEERRIAAGEDRADAYAAVTALFERAGGYGAEARLERELEEAFPAARRGALVGELSGGERRRLALAAAFAEAPDVLLLDEPTNHLDLPGRAWLARRLRAFQGGAVIASHDRALLDDVATRTAATSGGELVVERGGYTAWRERRDARARGGARRAKERAKEEARIRAAQAQLRAWGTARAHRARRSLERRLPHAPEELPAEAEQGALELRARRTRGPVLRASGLAAEGVLEGARVRLEAGDKVALLGPNGSGKSTLLALLARERPSDDPEAEFFERSGLKVAVAGQRDRGLEDGTPVLAQIARWTSEPRARSLLALARVPEPRWTAPPETLSGGERARAGAALLLAREADLLLLDEPTNDLDLPMIEALETALADAPSAVVVATHDRRFAEAVATRAWAIEEGRLVEYRGGVEGYLAGRRRLEPDLSDGAPDASTGAAPDGLPDGGAEPDPEGALARLEDERRAVEAALDDRTVLSEREVARLLARQRELQEALMAAYDARWAERSGPPAPSFRVREGPAVVTADPDGEGGLTRLASVPPARLVLRRQGGVAHLAILDPEGGLGAASLLPWARARLADAAARLAVYALGVGAVQMQVPSDRPAPPPGGLFEDAGAGWAVARAAAIEAREGWVRTPEARAASEERAGVARRRRRRRRRRSARGGGGAPDDEAGSG